MQFNTYLFACFLAIVLALRHAPPSKDGPRFTRAVLEILVARGVIVVPPPR